MHLERNCVALTLAFLLTAGPALRAARGQEGRKAFERAAEFARAQEWTKVARVLIKPDVRKRDRRLAYMYAWARLKMVRTRDLRASLCKPALKALGRDAFAYNALGCLDFNGGNYLAAAKWFEKAEELSTLNETSINNWIEALHKYAKTHKGKRSSYYESSKKRMKARDLRLEVTRAPKGMRRAGTRWVTVEQYQRWTDANARMQGLYVQADAADKAAAAREKRAGALRKELIRFGSDDDYAEQQRVSQLRSSAELAERDATELRLRATTLRAEADGLRLQFNFEPWTGLCEAFAAELLDDSLQEILSR
jgi:tetratricopeptide (TPR) repeat protein